MTKKNLLLTDMRVTQFQMLYNLVDSIYTEMKEFSKKKPDDLLNEFKVKQINRVLKDLIEFLKSEPTSGFMELLDGETLPSNSDAILVISQFKASMDNFKNANISKFGSWKTVENPDGINID